MYETAVGRVDVAICYDRHYLGYMRRLGELGAPNWSSSPRPVPS